MHRPAVGPCAPGSSNLLLGTCPACARAVELASWEILPGGNVLAPRDFLGQSSLRRSRRRIRRRWPDTAWVDHLWLAETHLAFFMDHSLLGLPSQADSKRSPPREAWRRR